jgi:hypothetical protein
MKQIPFSHFFEKKNRKAKIGISSSIGRPITDEKVLSDDHLGISVSTACRTGILCLTTGSLRCCSRIEGLFEIGYDIVDVFCADRDTNEVLLSLTSPAPKAQNERGMEGREGGNRGHTSVTPLAIFSSSDNCSWVVAQG